MVMRHVLASSDGWIIHFLCGGGSCIDACGDRIRCPILDGNVDHITSIEQAAFNDDELQM